jgi:3-deoxy-7-phosphoheptulonate synthase
MINPNELTTDWRIAEACPLASPARLADTVPLTPANRQTVLSGRRRSASIMRGEDDRLLVVVGPCSIHDRAAALSYAERLARVADRLADQLVVVMRAYFEKPRTSVGWKGLVADPGMDDSFRVGDGLLAARALLVEILTLGLPVGCEFVDPMTTPYLADAVSWGCVGARTAESQVHRQLASGLALPVGFKNSTSGDIQVAVDAVGVAARPQLLVGIDRDGRTAAAFTDGNPDAHIVLRGGASGPNADRAGVAEAVTRLRRAGLAPQLMVDASHGNSGRDHRLQPRVAADIGERLAHGEPGITGVMLESFLRAGRQEPRGSDPSRLIFGQSVTDACMGWSTTVGVLEGLARSVDRRRRRGQAAGAQALAGRLR